MEITYIGHSCFKIRGKDTTLVIDPYDPKMVGYKLPNLTADIVLATHDHNDHAFFEGVGGYTLKIETPGDYEKSDTFVYGYRTFHDDKKGDDRGKNTIYEIHIDEFVVLHLGDLGHELTIETLERLTDIDVLMIPVGGIYTLDAKSAVKVISQIEPKIVIPMHYQTKDLKFEEELQKIDDFLGEIGVEGNGVKNGDKLKLSTTSQLPEELQVYVLSPQH